MKWQNKLITIISLLACLNHAAAYETTTHLLLSINAADRSVLASDPSLLSDLGMSPYGSPAYTDSTGLPNLTASSIIGLGSKYEDNVSVAYGARVLRHFFDPQFNNYQGRGLTVGPASYPASPDWALEDRSTDSLQDYSYRDARQHFLNAFICGTNGHTKACQLSEMSIVFQTLGQVIHHLQDMGQPQHTRNDIHIIEPYNFYETYTQTHEGTISGILAKTTYPKPSNSPYFSTPREYWYTPDGKSHKKGMAEFTGQNFLSMDTMLVASSASPTGFVNNPNFPLPSGANVVVKSEAVTLTGYSGNTVSDTIDFLEAPVTDELTGTVYAGVRIAARSIFDAHLKKLPGGTRALSDNSQVYDNLYPILMPRIAAFSTNMINYFFRGRIDMVPATSGTGWQIKNLSSEPMSGAFTLFYDDGTDTRKLITTNWPTLSIGAGSMSPVVTFTKPTGTVNNYILVFNGVLGNESGAVAGKVFPPSHLETPCGGPLSGSGGNTGYSKSIDLGSTPGKVNLGFEAYDIPDAIYITPANNTSKILMGSKAPLVSGYNVYSFNFDPAALNTTKVTVNVIGNTDPGTEWEFALGCPGQSLTNSNMPDPRVSVTFSYGAPVNSASCSFNVSVDGTYIGSIGGRGAIGTVLTAGVGAGRTHKVEYTNISNCTWDSTSGMSYPATMRDNQGLVDIPSPFFSLSFLINVRP
jgi:hypothetical protein